MGDFNPRKGLLSDCLGGSINDLQFSFVKTNSTDLNSNPDSELSLSYTHQINQLTGMVDLWSTYAFQTN